jgi:polysaccharide export outer membrane protein
MSTSLFIGVGGCQAPDTSAQIQAAQEASKPAGAQTIREGDVLKIEFPGAPTLDTTQQVRRDGRITLSVVGEVKATDQTPSDLEKQLIQLYSTQLVDKEVTVTVVSSSISVFVNGAVIRPGKIVTDHAPTVLEAVMEAGGFDSTKADIKAVKVIRSEGGRTKIYIVNLKSVLDGVQSEPFYLKPSDIVYVPERFSWF